MEKRIVWHIEKWPMEKLKPYDKNPRIITEAGLNQLRASFDEIGFCQPININTDGTILSGHARYLQLKSEGATEVECYVPDRLLTPKQEEAVIIRMNKNVAGAWDFDVLANEFEIEDLLEWGFKDFEIPSGESISMAEMISEEEFEKFSDSQSEQEGTNVLKLACTSEDYSEIKENLSKLLKMTGFENPSIMLNAILAFLVSQEDIIDRIKNRKEI